MTEIEARTLIDIQKVVEGGYIDVAAKSSQYKLIPKTLGYDNQNFMLDISKVSISITKTTTQKRVRNSVILVRLDTDAYHSNPPFSNEILSFVSETNIISLIKKYSEYRFKKESHLHIYVQNFGEKWAFPLSEFGMSEGLSMVDNIIEFCTKFNIDIPRIRGGLF